MFTVHEKNRPPETGFSDTPAGEFDSEREAIDAAKVLAQSKESFGNTVQVVEQGTNCTWTVSLDRGDATVGYVEGEPTIVYERDPAFIVTMDAREVPVEVRKEEDDNGAVAIFLDEPPGKPLVGDFTVNREEIVQ